MCLYQGLGQQFSTCRLQSLWGSNDPFPGVTWDHQKTQIFPLWFITAAKWQLWRRNENNFIVWGVTTWEIVLVGCRMRKVENHWPSNKRHKEAGAFLTLTNVSERKAHDKNVFPISVSVWMLNFDQTALFSPILWLLRQLKPGCGL